MAKKPSNTATEFFVDTRFQQQARRPGGISREEAIANAQNKIDDLRPDLDAWLDRELQELNELVAEAEAGKANARWIHGASEHARQLRNVGSTIGLELLSYVADTLCETFDAINSGAECNMDSIRLHVDAMLLARRDQYRNLRPDQVPELTDGLRRVLDASKRSNTP